MTQKPQAERNVRKPAPTPVPAAAISTPAERRQRLSMRARLVAWRDQHLYGFFSSLGRLAARPIATALTVLMLGFALALPLLFWLAFQNAHDLSGGLRESREITVFLKPSLEAKAAADFAADLKKRDDVADVVVRTPEQGLAEFRQLSGFGEALDVLKDNPLPNVLVVTPRSAPDGDNPPLVADIRADARADLVQYDAAWRRRLTGILGFGERAVAVIAALLALATLLVIGNTVRMDVQARDEEIAVMQLIGASDAFVRRPFLYSGLWYGLLGGVLALVIVVGAEYAIAGPLERLLASYDHRLALSGLDIVSALVVIAASSLLGWVGAFLATGRHMAAGHPQ